jgi:hypothetical protein
MQNRIPFAMGGVSSEWLQPVTGEVVKTYSIITTPANELMAEIQNNKKRMPLIIQPNDIDRWLSDIKRDEIEALMTPLPDGILRAHSISKLITTRRGADINVPEVQTEYNYNATLF